MRTCTLSAALNNPSLIILGAKKMMNVLFGMTKMMKNMIKMRMIRGVKMDKILMWIAIILIGLSGFSIKINSFEFEWLGLLETIIRIFK